MPSFETELELTVRRLEGQTIDRVSYLYAWDAPPSLGDGALLAITLEMASERCFEVLWADEIGLHHGFHIALHEVTGPDRDRGRVVDVTEQWRALGRIGRIGQAMLEWGDTRTDLRSGFAIGVAIHSDHLRRADYPRALVFRSGAGAVTAIETRLTNSLTVTWR